MEAVIHSHPTDLIMQQVFVHYSLAFLFGWPMIHIWFTSEILYLRTIFLAISNRRPCSFRSFQRPLGKTNKLRFARRMLNTLFGPPNYLDKQHRRSILCCCEMEPHIKKRICRTENHLKLLRHKMSSAVVKNCPYMDVLGDGREQLDRLHEGSILDMAKQRYLPGGLKSL